MADSELPGRRKTRSGGEYSLFANAVALQLPNIRLTQLLQRRDEGPDSDTDSLDESDDDSLPQPPPPPFHPISSTIPPPPPRPATFIRVAPPGHPPGTRLPNGLMPGAVIRIPYTPPPKRATAAEVKARRLAKKHDKARALRSLERESQRAKAGTRLKAVTQRRIRQSAPAIQLNITVEQLAPPVATSGWQAVRQDETNPRHYDLDEIRRSHPHMRVFDWDGIPTPVIDADRTILLVLGGEPPNASDWGDVAEDALSSMGHAAAAVEVHSEPRWRRKAGLSAAAAVDGPHRGNHAAKHVGASMGGGQRYPQNLAHSVCNLAIFAGLFGRKSFERITGWTNPFIQNASDQKRSPIHGLRPNLHEYYRATYIALCDWDRLQARAKHIRRNFPEKFSVFTTATYNFGPVTVTLPHIDFGNLAWGWCAITALGHFDPDRGGHLVLWDLNLIIRFPPGSTILLPSAILRHSNLNIGPNETRSSFTQFTPAGIFRWVYNDFRTDKDINSSKSTTPDDRERRHADQARRWQEGIRMYRRWDGPVQ
ncbi:hypothetical protein C8R46DRAFT_1208044 [Mycena filopes]|nr:hypothetical protein C8R46DRAFT_1208044 [Mycena filopes]